MAMIDVHEAATHLARLLDRARGGEEIVIAKNGEPCALLVPAQDAAARTPGLLQGKVDDAFFEPLPEEELGELSVTDPC